ncbi:MAG: tetratricopeptide repeat protein [Planctomycetota bacterium]
MRYVLTSFMFLLLATLSAPSLLAQVSIDATPRRNFTVQCDGANREWDVRPIRITDKNGRTITGASEGDFRPDIERWDRTGLVRRYGTELARNAFEKFTHTSAPEGARFYFYALNPRQPRAEGNVNLYDERLRIYWSPASAIELKAYPQSWVDVYEAYVTRQEGDARRLAVKEWEAEHRAIIENVDQTDDAFSPEERNEFARFYQAQFVFVRDRNPKLANIYTELAQFHRDRNNLDAELSTYLDALRAGVESPDREAFALEVGRIFVYRLNLHGEAIPFLEQARNHTEALYLLARCQLELENYSQARSELNELINVLTPFIDTPPTVEDNVVLQTTAAEEMARANLMLAELAFKLLDYASADAAIARIPSGNPSYDAGRVLFCAMLLQRGDPNRDGQKSDVQKIRDTLKALSFWTQAVQLTTPSAATVYPLDPLMARALVLYAQTDQQYYQPRPESPDKKISAEALRFLDAAKSIDPLSAEPYYAEGRLYQRRGWFIDALAAYQSGLDVNPKHVLLNYSVAELNLKSGVLSVAQDYLGRCLKYDPQFYPAHTMLGEIALSEVDRVRDSLLIRMAAGDRVDYAGELVPQMKEAAAFFTSSLAIKPDQPGTSLALANLMLRLSEVAPLTVATKGDADSVRAAYLTKARDLSRELIDQLEEFAKQDHPRNMTERELASIPSLACFNVYAYALYSLGEYQAALGAFQEHIAKSRDKQYIPDAKARRDYEESEAIAYAIEWVDRIEQNQRQYFQVDEFEKDSTSTYFGSWSFPMKLLPDRGFTETTRIRSGKLYLEVNQKESGIISRFETEQPHSTLSTFEAEFTSVGDLPVDRGIYLTRTVKPTSTSTSEGDPRCSVFIGIDADGRVFWETHKYDLENRNEKDKRMEYGLIDVSLYGTVPLDPDQKLTLALRRQLSQDRSEVEYWAVINGYEVRLPVNKDKDSKKHIDELNKVDFNQGRYAITCGFFTRALLGGKATVEVERVKFIYDGGLDRKK